MVDMTKISRAFELTFKVFRANISVTFSSEIADLDFLFWLVFTNRKPNYENLLTADN